MVVVVPLKPGCLDIDIDQPSYPFRAELIHVLPRDERTHRPPNEDDIIEVLLFDESVDIAGVLRDRVPQFRLFRPAVAPEIDGDCTVPVRETSQLRLEKPQTVQHTVEKHDRLALAVVFVIEVCPVTLDIRHGRSYIALDDKPTLQTNEMWETRVIPRTYQTIFRHTC